MDEHTSPAPPVMSPELPETPSRWPTTIGVINIVFAALGLICYGCGSLNTVASPWLAGMMPEGQRPATAQGIQLVIQIAQMCTATLLSIWLLFAGIGVLKRRAWARPHCIGWSVAKIILTLLGSVAAAILAPQTVEQINDQLSQQGPAPFTVTVAMIKIFVIVSMLWFLIWPVFLLLWFSRGRIADEVAEWAAESQAVI
ncbi:MAG: hypothetical protein ACYTE6_04010 [Planctomycetota bacterium]|jgi:hypothetical protein